MALAYQSMICHTTLWHLAAPGDGGAIRQIAAATGVFNAGEVQCAADIWEEYLRLGIETSGYTFFVEREGEDVLGFACVGPRSLTDRVYDLYWIAVDPRALQEFPRLLNPLTYLFVLKFSADCVTRNSSPYWGLFRNLKAT